MKKVTSVNDPRYKKNETRIRKLSDEILNNKAGPGSCVRLQTRGKESNMKTTEEIFRIMEED